MIIENIVLRELFVLGTHDSVPAAKRACEDHVDSRVDSHLVRERKGVFSTSNKVWRIEHKGGKWNVLKNGKAVQSFELDQFAEARKYVENEKGGA